MEIRNKECVSISLPGPGTHHVEMMGGRGGDVSFIAPDTVGNTKYLIDWRDCSE